MALLAERGTHVFLVKAELILKLLAEVAAADLREPLVP
tara:strand:- start:220 stop:333 length:114 start_codon:yes stop_codon:yes gene_type:complete